MKYFLQVLLLSLLVPQVYAASAQSEYVGRETCRGCHAEQDKLWQGSHHDLAMQHADDKTVLGDFSDTVFNYAGNTSKFYKQNNKYMVRTDGPDGELHEYERVSIAMIRILNICLISDF